MIDSMEVGGQMMMFSVCKKKKCTKLSRFIRYLEPICFWKLGSEIVCEIIILKLAKLCRLYQFIVLLRVLT